MSKKQEEVEGSLYEAYINAVINDLPYFDWQDVSERDSTTEEIVGGGYPSENDQEQDD